MVPTNARMKILYFGKKRRIKTKCLWRQSFQSIVKVLADKSKHCVSGVKQLVRVQTIWDPRHAPFVLLFVWSLMLGKINGDDGILFQASTYTTIVFRGKISFETLLKDIWIRHLKSLECETDFDWIPRILFSLLETLDAFVGRYLTQWLLIMQLFSGEVISQVRDVVTW